MTAITPISNSDSPTQGARPTAGALGAQGLINDFDTFLSLLTTQLRSQDPLNPMDPTEFVSQLTQFSQLEQTVAQTQTLEEVAALMRDSAAAADLGFLGRDVEAESGSIALADGEARFAYEVLAPGEEMAVRIFNEDDALVASIDVDNAPGRRSLVWDGQTDGGDDAPAGVYRAELVAIDGEATRLGGRILVSGEVSDVRFAGGGARIGLASGLVVDPARIVSVEERAVSEE